MADTAHGATTASAPGHGLVPGRATGPERGTTAGHSVSPAHPVAHAQPQDWGWHHEWRRSAPVIGWIFTVSLLTLVFGNHTGHVEDLWIIGIAAFMVILLVRDRIRRKNAWRA